MFETYENHLTGLDGIETFMIVAPVFFKKNENHLTGLDGIATDDSINADTPVI